MLFTPEQIAHGLCFLLVVFGVLCSVLPPIWFGFRLVKTPHLIEAWFALPLYIALCLLAIACCVQEFKGENIGFYLQLTVLCAAYLGIQIGVIERILKWNEVS